VPGVDSTPPARRSRAISAGSARRADPRRKLGRLGEQAAAAHLERLGYAIVARNVRTRYGEIDLIAFGQDTLVFVEVKSRRARSPATAASGEHEPLAWLRPRQRLRVRRLATAWLADRERERPRANDVRFDAIGVVLDRRERLVRLDHIENAW
jgi:putative endonuclease